MHYQQSQRTDIELQVLTKKNIKIINIIPVYLKFTNKTWWFNTFDFKHNILSIETVALRVFIKFESKPIKPLSLLSLETRFRTVKFIGMR